MKKNNSKLFKTFFFLLGFSLLLLNCEKEDYLDESKELILETVSKSEALAIFDQKNNNNALHSKEDSNLEIDIHWDDFNQETLNFTDALLSNVKADLNITSDNNFRLLFIRINGELFKAIETQDVNNKFVDGKLQDGKVYYHRLDGTFFDAYQVENGKTTKRLVPKPKEHQASFLNFSFLMQECGENYFEEFSCFDQLEGFEMTATVDKDPSPIFYVIAYESEISNRTGDEDIDNEGTRGGGSSPATEEYCNTFGMVLDPVTGDCVVDDQIINELEGEEKCVYEKLKELELFKSTIKKFENSGSYNLIIKRGNCKNTDTGCTDDKDISNGNITIIMEEGVNGRPLDFASDLLHEGIHAEIFKYVDEHLKGIDPNDRENLMHYYWFYKQKGDPRYFNTNYQHQHMADKYIKPLTEALRALDNYNYTLDYYLGFAWTGLHEYGFDDYLENGKLVTLTTEKIKEYEKKSGIVRNNTKFNGNGCK